MREGPRCTVRRTPMSDSREENERERETIEDYGSFRDGFFVWSILQWDQLNSKQKIGIPHK